MNSSDQHKQDLEPVRGLLEARLRARMRETAGDSHPDDDVINAFVEGRLDENESHAIVSHLIVCSPCLHLTAQLIRLQPVIEDTTEAVIAESEPGPLQRFFDRLAIGVVPAADEDVVFAYQDNGESEAEDESKEDDKTDA